MNYILNSIRNILAATVIHIPMVLDLFFSQVLCSVLAATQSIWSLYNWLFSKGFLCARAHHLPSRCEVPKSQVKFCFKTWQSQGSIIKLWKEVEGLFVPPTFSSNSPSISNSRAIHCARLGRLSNAINALSCNGVANP